MKKLFIRVAILIGVVLVVPMANHRTLNNDGVQPAGNGNCTYPNGMVMLCPSDMIYNGSTMQSAPEVPVEPQNNPTAPSDPINTPVDDTDTPIVAPPPVQATTATQIQPPPTDTITKDGGLTAATAP